MKDVVFWHILITSSAKWLLLGAGISGLVRYRQLPAALRYLVGLIWFGLGVELLAFLLTSNKLPNLILVPVDAVGELVLLSLVYDRVLRSPGFTRVRPWLVGAFVAYAAFSTVLAPEMARFKPLLQVLQCLLVLGLVGLYFRKLLHELQVEALTQDPLFWVSAGLLLYFLGKLQIALFSNYLLEHFSQQLNLSVWTIHGLLLVLLYCCYCRALWLRPRS